MCEAAPINPPVRISSSEDGSQTATLRRVEGAQAAGMGDDGQIIVEAAPVSTGRNARVTWASGYRFFAGWRSDPFFFDTLGALNNLQFTGDDFFADKDVCSIVLEVPNSILGPERVGLWARTLDGAGGGWIQADRGTLPAQAVFLVGAERHAYFTGEPANDARFVAVFAVPRLVLGGRGVGEVTRKCCLSMMVRASQKASITSSGGNRSSRSETPTATSRCLNGPQPASVCALWVSCTILMQSGNMLMTETQTSVSSTRHLTRLWPRVGPWWT